MCWPLSTAGHRLVVVLDDSLNIIRQQTSHKLVYISINICMQAQLNLTITQIFLVGTGSFQNKKQITCRVQQTALGIGTC